MVKEEHRIVHRRLAVYTRAKVREEKREKRKETGDRATIVRRSINVCCEALRGCSASFVTDRIPWLVRFSVARRRVISSLHAVRARVLPVSRNEVVVFLVFLGD